MPDQSIKKGILGVLVANLINMIFNLFINFAQPKFLSVDSYADIKSFQLYVAYIGLLHLGYVDGMYLRYGGKQLDDLDKNELSLDLSTFRFFQFAIEIICVIISVITNNYVFIFVALSIIPYNIGSYYKSLYQATGEFNKYGKIMNLYTITAFLLNSILILFVKTDNSFIYIMMYFLSYIGIWIFLETTFIKTGYITKDGFFKYRISYFANNVKNGFFLMLGNLSSMILTSIDRWFVKGLLLTVDFAYYSFAVSIENFLNIAITPVTITLYNYFCNNDDREKIIRVRNYICIFAVFLPIVAFPAKFIIRIFLDKYMSSLVVMLCLFGSQIFYIVIKSIYINLYKVRLKQNLYFKKLVAIILWGVVLNSALYLMLRNKEAFAIGTLFTAVSWFVVSCLDFPEIRMTLLQILHLCLAVALLLIFGMFLSSITGFLLYGAIMISLTYLLYKNEIKNLIHYAKTKSKKVAKR